MTKIMIAPDIIEGDLITNGDLKIKVYSQISEPTLDTDEKIAIWKDTDDSDRIYLIFRKSAGDQVKIELSTSGVAVLESMFNANTVLKADSDDTPSALTVPEQTLIGRITAGVITGLTATQIRTLINVEEGADVTDTTNVNAAGAVMETDYNANTVLAATTDDTPAPITMAEQTVLARLTGGNIDDVSIGITDNNIVQIDHASVINDDFAKFTANGIEGRSYTEVREDLSLVIQRYVFYADYLDSPNNSDWAVNALAPLVPDATEPARQVRVFDNITEEGVGFKLWVPAGTTNIRFTFVSNAQGAPAGVRTVGLKLYERGLGDSWSTGVVLNDIDIPTSTVWVTDAETKTLTSLGLIAGQPYQFELTRINPTAGTELADDWGLRMLMAECI